MLRKIGTNDRPDAPSTTHRQTGRRRFFPPVKSHDSPGKLHSNVKEVISYLFIYFKKMNPDSLKKLFP